MKQNYQSGKTGISGMTDFSAGLMSGDMFNMSEKLQKVRSNLSFRVNSAREVLMGVRSQSAMSPMDRRSELRQNRLELMGVRSEESSSSTESRTSPSPSGRISTGGTSQSSSDSGMSSSTTSSDDSPLMSEVDAGTKQRAQDQGFGT